MTSVQLRRYEIKPGEMAVSHEGEFATAEADYYASPERAALPANPADFIDVMHLAMVRVERI
jgi:hypothetical protein